MPRPDKPQSFEDQLDAALDGIRPGVVTGEFAPLLEVAGELRAACARMRLDPKVAREHLAGVLGPAASRAAAPRRRWRRRVAAFALAAALAVTPLVALSTRALPGEPLYQVKLTVENARLAAASWSPNRTADERAHIARTRLGELDQLVADGSVERIPGAITGVDSAMAAAQHAIGALRGQDDLARVAALQGRLRDLRAGRTAELTSLVRRLPSSTPVAARVRIEGTVERSLSQTGAAATPSR